MRIRCFPPSYRVLNTTSINALHLGMRVPVASTCCGNGRICRCCRSSEFPVFDWVDATAVRLGAYQPWASGQPADGSPPGMCGYVNATAMVSYVGSWMNAPCTRSMPFMCR